MLDSQYTRRRPAPSYDPAAEQTYSHSRTRTSSSSTFTVPMNQGSPASGSTGGHGNYGGQQYYHPQQQQYQQHQHHQPQYPHHPQMAVPTHLVQPQGNHQRRSPSVNTFSTISSNGGANGNMAPPAAYRTSPSLDIRRSTSSRSGGGQDYTASANSYVALLRRQKATVWSERAQYEDPRMVAAQRAAKMRANKEIVEISNAGLGLTVAAGRTSTGLSSAGGKVAAKIKHHGKPGVVGYTAGANYMAVGGVPLRLSATEVEGEDSDEDDAAMQRLHHRRTGSSGRSSQASIGRRGVIGYRASSSGGGMGPSASQGGRRWSPGDTPERAGSLVIEEHAQADTGGAAAAETPAEDTGSGKARSFASGSSAEKLDSVPDIGSAARLASKSLMNATVTREKSTRNPEDLKRRGSVDERTMTLTSGRLFIANPD